MITFIQLLDKHLPYVTSERLDHDIGRAGDEVIGLDKMSVQEAAGMVGVEGQAIVVDLPSGPLFVLLEKTRL